MPLMQIETKQPAGNPRFLNVEGQGPFKAGYSGGKGQQTSTRVAELSSAMHQCK